MQLRRGKLYRVKRTANKEKDNSGKFGKLWLPIVTFYFGTEPKNLKSIHVGINRDLIFLFLEKGKYVSKRELAKIGARGWKAHTPYYFLVGEKIMTFRKTYEKDLGDFFEEAKKDIL